MILMRCGLSAVVQVVWHLRRPGGVPPPTGYRIFVFQADYSRLDSILQVRKQGLPSEMRQSLAVYINTCYVPALQRLGPAERYT